MQSKSVKAFINELRNYNYYASRVVTLTNSIEYCYHLLGGVHSIDYSKELAHTPPNKEREYKLRTDIERYEQIKSRMQSKITEMDEILNTMEITDRTLVFDVYVKGNPMRKVASANYMSLGALQKRLNKTIKKAVEVLE